jgi:RNA polymerase sigma factor (sigma-70 family)
MLQRVVCAPRPQLRLSMDIYQRYGPALVRKARRLLANEADALDVVQALFIDLLTKGRTDVDLPYLYHAVTRRCLNWLRDERNRARLLSQQQPTLQGAARISPDTQVLGLKTLGLLAQRLDPNVLETLVYRHLDEMGVEEIGELMRVSRKTVAARLKLAEQAVQEMRDRGEA